MFGDVPGYEYMMQLLPWAMVATVIGVLLIVFAKIMGKSVARKSRQPFIGMTVQDIDRMRKEGVISEDEYKRIRHKAAERELESSRQKDESAEERRILAEVAINPDAARKLLKPEQLAEAKSTIHKQPAAPPTPAPAQQPSSNSDFDEFDWGDPLAKNAGAQPSATASRPESGNQQPTEAGHPHPGKIRVPPPTIAPKKEEPGELELLLQKGAITREDYERLKALVKK